MKKLLLSLALITAGFASNAQVFSENWTAPQAGWVSTQLDADTNYWGVASVSSGTFASQGNFAYSESWQDDGTSSGLALTPDNLLISPVINASGLTGSLTLSFKVGSPETTASGFYEEYLSVYVTDGYNGLTAALASPIHSQVLAGGDQLYTFNYSINNMLGADSVMLVFRHHNCTEMNFIVLDDINVSNTAGIDENVISASVYPNPATTTLNIDVAEEVTSVVILTTDGKIVASSTNKNVDIASLSEGLYLYQVITVSGKYAKGNFVKK